MNLKNWSKDHTYGLLIGIVTPLIFVPIIILIVGWIQNYSFDRLWHEFVWFTHYRIKILTISNISNLILFYYFLNKERYKLAMGIILGTICYAPYVIFIKFF